MLRLVSNQPAPVRRDSLPDACIQAVVQWQIMWLRSCAIGFVTLADIADSQLERIWP